MAHHASDAIMPVLDGRHDATMNSHADGSFAIAENAETNWTGLRVTSAAIGAASITARDCLVGTALFVAVRHNSPFYVS